MIGVFEGERAGLAASFTRAERVGMFKNNFHVMHRNVFDDQKDRLVLVKGSANSRLPKKAVKISSVGRDKNGRPLHRLAPEMQATFGGFQATRASRGLRRGGYPRSSPSGQLSTSRRFGKDLHRLA
jgi:hypothetical protein